jgi:TonB-dependent receptor
VIESQDLKSALRKLADAAGRRIEFAESAVEGKVAPAVTNARTFSLALHAMLKGSGLSAAVRSDGVIVITQEGSNTADSVGVVTVTGRRDNDAAQAQLDAENTVSVLTPDDIARAPDMNVAEALSRLPGVTVLNFSHSFTNGVSIDTAGRGEGNYVALRGLDPQYNVNTINGVDVAQGRPYSRGVDLSLLPPSGMQRIVYNKTVGADMDGDSIGGIIDFRTPTAYDFRQASRGEIDVGGQFSDRAKEYGQDPYGGSVSANFSRRIGDAEQFGIYAAAYYDKHDYTNSIVDGIYPAATNGQFAYALSDVNGNSLPGLNPASNLVLTGVDAGATNGYSERYGANISVDWHLGDSATVYGRATYAYDDEQQFTYYSQVYGNGVTTQQIGGTGVYTPLIQYIQPRFYYTTNPETSQMDTLQLGFTMQDGKGHYSGSLFGSYGADNQPDHFELSARLPEVASGFAYGGSSMFTYSNGVPLAILTPAELAAIGNVAGYGARRSGELSPEFSHQSLYGAKFDAVFDMGGGVVKSIAAGIKYTGSSREHTYRDYTTNKLYTTDANDPSFGSLGFLSGGVAQVVPGYYNYPVPFINQTAAVAGFNAAIAREFGSLVNASDQCGPTITDAENCDTQSGTEDVASLYMMATMKAGKVEVTPGLRFEHTSIDNTYWVIPVNGAGDAVQGHFESGSSSYDKPLPSIQAKFQPDPLTVYRAALWTSYLRPSMFQLGGGSQYSHSVDTGITSITKGNPGLRAMDAVNLDVSGEWLNDAGGSASAAAFYKSLRNFIYDSVNAYTNAVQLTNGFTRITTPENGGSGRVYGLELAARQRLQMLPAPLDGLGIGANLTFERSSVNTMQPGLDTNERLLNQPDVMANLTFFYDKGPYHGDLTYRHVGSYVSNYATLGSVSVLDTWVRPNDKVDLHLGYDFPAGFRTDLGITNLTNSESYHATIGRNSDTIPSIVFSGRIYTLKVGYSF